MATATETTTLAAKPSAECVGEGCIARDTWPLHHVRHRGELRRLCTSCVLKYHPGSFCCVCFAVLDAGAIPPPPPPDSAAPVVHCSKCPSITHLSCLRNPDLSCQFVCPCCEHPEGFSFFVVEEARAEGRQKRICLADAKVLLAAARLAAGSMSRAAAAARGEAERKAREAVIARKRAREMLERAYTVSTMERESTVTVSEPPKKKITAALVPRPVNNSAAEAMPLRRFNNREVDKWLRFHEMGPHVGDVKSISRVGNVKEGVNCAVSAEKGKKGSPSVLSVKEEKVAVAGEPEKGPRMPPSTQDALSSRTNSKVVFTGSTSPAILHS